jgi:hypothetical protein
LAHKLAFIFAALLLFSPAPAPASQGPVHEPQAGLPLGYRENPYQYRYGRATSVHLIQLGDGKGTRMGFSPVGTYMLFPDETFTFCGDQSELLDFGPSDLVVLVFSRRMHRPQCYDLLRIDVIDKHHSAGQTDGPTSAQ